MALCKSGGSVTNIGGGNRSFLSVLFCLMKYFSPSLSLSVIFFDDGDDDLPLPENQFIKYNIITK